MFSLLAQRGRSSARSLLDALTAPHGIDRYLELVHPMLAVGELRAEVTEVDRTADGTLTLALRPNQRWQGFRAGQFVRLSVGVDGVRRTRCYSPASSQHRADGQFVLSVKAHTQGLVSRYLYQHAEPGLVVGLSPAEGEFTLPDPRPDRIVLISGGSGITPVLSMLATLVDEGYCGRVAFLHYSPEAGQVAQRVVLTGLAEQAADVELAFGYTRAAGTGQLGGRFGPAHLAQVADWFTDAEFYACGPQPLLEAVRHHLTVAGLADRLHVESFTPPTLGDWTDEVTGSVSFTGSDVVAPNNGATLLEQAEAAGLAPEHGCRMGICFSCTATKTTGCTRNLVTGELDSDENTEIQLCISAPAGDVSIAI